MDAMERIAKLKKSLAEQERTGTPAASQSSAQISAKDRITLAKEKIKEKATSGANLSGEAWTRATPAQTKVPEKVNSGFLDRAGDTLRGTVDRQVEGYTRGLEKLTEGLGKAGSWMQNKKEEKQAEQDKQYLDKYQKDLDDALAAGNEKAAKTAQLRIKQVQQRLKTNGDMGDYYDQVNAEAVRKLDAYGDQKGAESQAAFQRAKDGTGVLGGLAVDAGSALADVLGDAAANRLIPGLGTAGRVMRTFGHASEAAEEKGVGLGTQMLYGAGIAGIGEGVNRLFSGNPILEKATGKGALDDMLLPNLGKSLPGRMVKSGLGEGIEEGTEDILDAMYQKAVFGEKADPFSWKETGRDALIGGIVGGLTGLSKPRLTDENGNWYDANGKKNSDSDIEQTDMENAAFESKAVPDHLGAVALLQKNLGEVSSMQPVAVVTGQEVPKTGVATERVMTFLKNIGGKVERPGFGDVLFSKSKVKNSLLGHGFGEAKVELMAGVPGVIRDGKQIGFTANWKGRGYDSYVFAAPVQYRGEPVYVTAIVIRDSANRYYLHEAVDQNGNMIFGQNKSPDTASDGPAAVPQDTVAGSELSENSVPQIQGRNNGEIAEPNQQNGTEPTGKPDITPKLTDVQEPPAGREPTVVDLRRQAEGVGPNTVPQRPRKQNRNAMDTLGIHPVDDLADYSDTEYLRGSDEAKKKTSRARRQAEARLQPTRGEKKFAKGIANGDYTVDDIPASMSRATVTELADYYTAENSFKNTDGVQERGREIREETERLAAEMFHDEDSFRPISMLKMNERTPERVMRNIFGDRRGEQINEMYIYPVQQNEAEKVRFIQRQLDDVRTFEDSTGNRSTLTREERSIVQQIMEDRFVGETIASMEMREGIRNAAENIRRGKDPLDAAREFSLNAEERGLAQQYARWTENQERLRSGEFDSIKINNAVQEFAKKYDLFYDAVNDFLTAHGYGTIGFIKGYAPHMQGADTQNKLLSALRSMGVTTDASNLPTSISGLTADYKPGKRWNPHFQQRLGEKTDYDVYQGFESYVSYLGDIFYHTDDIARLRGISRYLRKTYGPEEINNAIDHAESLQNADLETQTEALKSLGKISDGTKLSYQDARKLLDEYINEQYKDITRVSKYGEFVKYIDNYANLLAGKQSMADRGMEYMAGRTSLNAGNKLVAAFGRAQVAGNVSSVLNQSAQLSQILAEVDGKYIAQAAADLAKGTGGKLWNIKKSDLFDQSDLLTGKKGIEYLTADDSKFDRMVSAMFKPADIMDSMVSALALQSKYNQLMAEGKPSEVAMLEADRWATQVMASRMKGSRPMAFESKNVVNQMLHMFQVEALNSWEHLSQDLPYKYRGIKEIYGKKAASRAVATVITKGLVSAFLLNRVAEAAYGGTPAPFDVLGYIANFVSSGMGLTTNEALKKLVNVVWEKVFGENLLDDEQEKKPFDWGDAVADTSWNVMNDIPFVRNGMGLLGLGDQTMPFTNMAEAAKGVGQALTAEERSAGEIGGSLLELGSTILPGGRQLQKTAQGVGTMLQGGRTYGYGDKKRLQYPVEQTPGNWVQAVLFGNSGLDETREFYASGDSGLTAKQTRTVESMAERGIQRTVAYNIILKIRDQENTTEKLQVIAESLLPDSEKLNLCYDVVADSNDTWPDKLKKLMDSGMTWNQAAETYEEYLSLKNNADMSAGEQATRFAAWADRSGASSEQASVITDTLKFYSQVPAEAGRYTTMTEAGLSSDKAEGLAMRISQLQPEAGKDTVSNLQRYEAVISDKSLSETEQLSALESMMEDTEFEKLEIAYAAGVAPGQYVEFKRATEGLVADKVNGKTVPGSKKEKVMATINGMQITNSQKTALYYAAGYKESTLDDAPWYGMPDTVQTGRAWDDIMPRLSGEVEMPRLSAQDRIDDIMPKLVK